MQVWNTKERWDNLLNTFKDNLTRVDYKNLQELRDLGSELLHHEIDESGNLLYVTHSENLRIVKGIYVLVDSPNARMEKLKFE